jgi:membrane-bound serine protease (ClpP class)
VIGVAAAVAFVASVVIAFSQSMWMGIIMLLVEITIIPALVVAAVKFWPHTPLGRLILAKRPTSEDEVLPDTEEYHRRDTMVGKTGVAKTLLLPSGDVRIEGRVYDAMSEGMAIEPGTPIKVVAVRTQRLVVRPLSDKEIAQLAGEGSEDILTTPIDSLGIDSLDDPLA